MEFLDKLYEKFWINTNVEEGLTDGRYKFYFKEALTGALFFVPNIAPGKVFKDGDKRTITVVSFSKDQTAGTFEIEVDVVNNPAAQIQKANLWAVGIFSVLGLLLTAFVLTKVEKLLEKGSVNIILIAVAMVTIYVLYKLYTLRGKKQRA